MEQLLKKQKAITEVIKKTEEVIKTSLDFARELEDVNKRALILDSKIRDAIANYEEIAPEILREIDEEWENIQNIVEKILKRK